MPYGEMKYELVNDDGYLMDSVRSTNYRSAREYFKNKFEGKYIMICSELNHEWNVRL